MKREPELTSFFLTLFIFYIVLQAQSVAAPAPAPPLGFDSGYYQGQSAASVQTPANAPVAPFGFDSGYYQGQSNASLQAPAHGAPPRFDSGYYQGQSMASLQSPAPASVATFEFDSSLQGPVLAAAPIDFTSASYAEQPGASFQSPSPLGPTPVNVSNVFFSSPNTPTQQQDSNKFVSGRSADEAYQKLANGFSLTVKTQAKNPFDTASSAPQTTLAGLKAHKNQVSILEEC